MHHHTSPQGRPTKPVPFVVNLEERREAELAFVPSPDEVARRAYFTYVNQGCKQGRDVQHWLQAEADMIEERNLSRTHGFHNKT